MNVVANKITLDVNKSGSQANIVAKYGESGARTALLSFTKNGRVYDIEEGNTVIIRAKKPDGTVIYNAAENQNGKAFFVLTEQFCSALGRVLCEVQILDGNGNTLYTPKFYIIVEGIVYTDGTITSTNEYSQLTQSILEAQEALATAESLKLIQVVEELPLDADSRYLYVIGREETILSNAGLPEEFETQARFETWCSDPDSKAVMLITTDADYPYLFIEGIELTYNTYDAPGEYRVATIIGDPVVYKYKKDINTWIEDSYIYSRDVSVGDLLFTGSSYTGADTPYIDYLVPNDEAVALYANHSPLMWVYGDFEVIRSHVIGNITYNEADNKFEIYEGVTALTGDGNAYIYDEDRGEYIEIANAAEVNERFDFLDETINDIQGDITDIQSELNFSVLVTLGNNPTINHTFNEIKEAIADYNSFPVRLLYTENNMPKYATGYINIYNQSMRIDFKFDISTNNKIHTVLATLNPSNVLTITEEYTNVEINETFVVNYTYDGSTNTWTCVQSANDIQTAINKGKQLILYLGYVDEDENVVFSNVNGAFANELQAGPNDMNVVLYWANMFGGTDNDCKYEFVFSHILGQNIIAGGLNIQQYQRKLIPGSNISITRSLSGEETISATGGGTSYTAGEGIEIVNNVISLPTVDDNDIGKVMTVVETEVDTGEVDEDDEPIYEYEYNWVVGKTRADIQIILNATGTSIVSTTLDGVTASANDILDYLIDNRKTKAVFAIVDFQGPSIHMTVPISFAGATAYVTGILNNGYLLSISISRGSGVSISKYYELVNYDNGDSEEY